MKIYTYSDPFKMDQNTVVWDAMTQYPHLCASDTLAQGLATKYNRTSFKYLRSVERLLGHLYSGWLNNPLGDMSIYLKVSEQIQKLKEAKDQRVFKANIQHVLESIKLLLVLGVEVSDFGTNQCTEQQKVFLKLFNLVKDDPCFSHFYRLKEVTQKDIEIAMQKGIIEEILRELELDSSQYMRLPHEKVVQEVMNLLTQELHKVSGQSSKETFKSIAQGYKARVRKLEHLKILLTQELLQNHKIVVHGVHHITPIMYLFFEQVERMGIEVIFIFNYSNAFPHIYDTWKKVYSWLGIGLSMTDEEILDISPIGQKLGAIIEGKVNQAKLDEKLIQFENITQFTHHISKDYEKAYQKVGGIHHKILSEMETQYYGINSEKGNMMLKMYYPEQFGERQFLAYPIGQMILSLYRMWNFKENKLHINHDSLLECMSSGVFIPNNIGKMISVYERIKVYFQDLLEDETTDVKQFIERIDLLKFNIKRIENQEDDLLDGFAFFSVTLDEVNLFKQYIVQLKKLTNLLFIKEENITTYHNHFKKLMDLISEKAAAYPFLSTLEQELIKNIQEKLAHATDVEVVGLKEDLEVGISLYLSQKKQLNTSNWIVRGFEQVDGGVLLSESTKAKKYHLGLISENNMSFRVKDELSWPLTEKFLEAYNGKKQVVQIMLTVMRERRNFYKYSLFYAVAFSRKPIELSYILQEDDEQNEPYYLLGLLGLKEQTIINKRKSNFPIQGQVKQQKREREVLPHKEGKELFAICPYKFLLTEGLHTKNFYRDEFQMRYYLSVYLQINIQNKAYDLSKPDEMIRDIQSLFPFWDPIIITDCYHRAIDKVNQRRKSNTVSKDHMRRKKNFMITKWYDPKVQRNYMNFEFDSEKFRSYMKQEDLLFDNTNIPHEGVCACCNLEKICLLNRYYVRLEEEQEEEVDQ